MYELKIAVKKVMGECTADPPMKPGDYFTVREGDIEIPKGGYICLWALQSLMPILTAKERELAENKDEDWMWRVHHIQCPDPKGRVIFRIDRVRKMEKDDAATEAIVVDSGAEALPGLPASEEGLRSLKIKVESVDGHCTSRMKPGDRFVLCNGRLYIPAGKRVCLYALQAAIPLLPAKQRVFQEGDWLKDDCRVLCPDPAGNVILHIEPME